MTRPRRSSAASEDSTATAARDQELGSMYDYLAKIILLGPSGTGKSCLLHRFVKNEWRVLSSQTIGVEFASKIIKVGTGARRKRIKLQLWDTAGTERFRSVSRSYYRGAAGAVLVYDVTSHATFSALPAFLNDARALASPNLTVLLAGNKVDLAQDDDGGALYPPTTSASFPSSSASSIHTITAVTTVGAPLSSGSGSGSGSNTQPPHPSAAGMGAQLRASTAPDGREVSCAEANRWASGAAIPVVMEVSALSGDGVEEVFGRLARMILTKIELGEIDPDDPNCGIQYGDSGGMWYGGGGGAAAAAGSDGASIKSTMTADEMGGGGGARRRRGRGRKSGMALREWEEVFTLNRGRRGGCC